MKAVEGLIYFTRIDADMIWNANFTFFYRNANSVVVAGSLK